MELVSAPARLVLKGNAMRLKQDLCIALVLAVVGTFGNPALAAGKAREGIAVVEDAMAEEGLSESEVAKVRRLIAQARECEGAGDDDGAASAMALASAILRIT
jgi:hypothetical protein